MTIQTESLIHSALTDKVKITHGDAGVGPYEYWGARGVDSHPYVEIEPQIIPVDVTRLYTEGEQGGDCDLPLIVLGDASYGCGGDCDECHHRGPCPPEGEIPFVAVLREVAHTTRGRWIARYHVEERRP